MSENIKKCEDGSYRWVYEFYESHTFTVDGKTVDGSFVITQSVTIIVT